MFRFLSIAILSLLTGACASVGRQTKDVVGHPPSVPPRIQLENVEFIPQSDNDCGPATLTMALRHNGVFVSEDTIARQVLTPEKDGALPMDMIAAARRHGAMAVQVGSISGILQEVAAGHPVVVLQNLGLSWVPQWHYSLVVGYDLPKQNLIFHSGEERFESKTFNFFEFEWNLADYWGLVVLQPGELAVSASELEHLKAAVGLELAGFKPEAERSFAAILKRWPESLGARVGLANLAYGQKKFDVAVDLLREAVKLHPESTAAEHNLRTAERALKARALNKTSM